MLTDYHVDLRPDDADASVARYLTAGNAERYRTVAAERGIEELGVSEHVYRFSQGAEDRTANLLERRPWDYVVGSVHFLSDGALDVEEFDVWAGGADPDRVWRRYFDTV